MPRLARYIPSMFQRRLLLLAALGLLGLLPPALQMARLTVLKGEQSLIEAEKRLVNETWLETIRGRIIDRKGRVLALDEASFDVAVDYPVISGSWAYSQAARKARRQPGSKWGQLSPEQREDLIQSHVPEFQRRLDAMWDRLGAIAGVSRADIENKRGQIVADVQAMAASHTERERLRREEQLRRGEELTAEVQTADVQRPILEQVSRHVMFKDVPEAVGFELKRLADPAGNQAELIGVHVIDASRRVYPMDTVDVRVAMASFPGPLRDEDAAAAPVIRVEGVATHILGGMRDRMHYEDTLRRPRVRPDGALDRGYYRVGRPGVGGGDVVGEGGVEQGAEDTLRGLRGLLTKHLDTGEQERIPPEHGGDVPITLDVGLQARIQALFDPSLGLTIVQPWHRSRTAVPPPEPFRELPLATPLNGAVVVLDVASGDVLAMVSMPSFSHRMADRVTLDQRLNRAIDRAYTPGSVVKPVVFCAAATARKVGIDEPIHCSPGHFFPGRTNIYRCWVFKNSRNQTTHDDTFGGGLDGSDAIMVSCNMFFFELGRRLGPEGISDWFTRFGLGPQAPSWNIFGPPPAVPRYPEESEADFAKRTARILSQRTLLHEHPGTLQRLPTREGQSPPPLEMNEAILMAIGQGPITWTPLHAADAYSTIARGGLRITPRLRADLPQARTDLGLSSAAVRKALDGLRRSANEDQGTTHHLTFDMPDGGSRRERTFNAPGIDIWAKSGTADAPWFEMDADDGTRAKFEADHSWCVFLAGVEGRPMYAVAVVIEHGGSGGRVAGPVANQVVHALVAEGYLPAPDRAGAGDQRADSSR